MCKKTVAIALGSNMGNRLQMLRRAVQLLTEAGICAKASSRVWETPPWGVKEQGRFLNMYILAETSLAPQKILETLKKTEHKLGRREGIKWGPREIDLDIILIENEVVDTPELQVPHPYMQERAFVLVPLAEIAPGTMHPVLHKTVRQLLEALPQTGNMDWIIVL